MDRVPMTMTQKILAAKANLSYVKAGDLIEANLDLVLGNDVTTPPAVDIIKKMGATKVFDKDKVCFVPDHFTPNKDIKSATLAKSMRDYACEQCLSKYCELGSKDHGIEHVILPDNGWVIPGDAVIGADSHTCTYGALGAFATGVGSTDLACATVSGKTWFKVPEAIKVVLTGKPNELVKGKDIILHLIGKIGVDGALYKSLEFTGEGVKHLTMTDRLTICNMAIEAGGKNGIFPVDDITREYVSKTAPDKELQVFEADDDAIYSEVVEIDLSKVPLTVALPHLPSNTKAASDVDLKIDQVVIGSCTNGRMDDIRLAASLFEKAMKQTGRGVASNIRCIVIPGSRKVYRQALEEGLLQIFDDAGCVISTPTCGPCLGGHMGVLAEGERCVSTTNRNFVGRMGHVKSEVILSGVPVAVFSAIAGRVADRILDEEEM